MNNILKINHVGDLTPAPLQMERSMDFINVFRFPYSDQLMAFFIRSKLGTVLIVNENLTPTVQAKAISIIQNKIRECGICETGILKDGFVYECGGSCCTK